MNSIIKIFAIILVVFFYCLVLATPVQFLWNFALVPAVDGLNHIGFFQALGINLLCMILFKNPSEIQTPSKEDE
jgi:hypothetical protein